MGGLHFILCKSSKDSSVVSSRKLLSASLMAFLNVISMASLLERWISNILVENWLSVTRLLGC